MTVYVGQDIEATTEGDLQVDGNGDLKLATYVNTVANTINFLLKTDKGDYRPDIEVGCNLGSLIGNSDVNETEILAKSFIREQFDKGYIDVGDYEIETLRVGPENLIILVSANITTFDENLELVESSVNLAFNFPYLEGALTTVYRNTW